MPSTINGLLIFLVALIPRVPGEPIYTNVVGLDWREDPFQRVVRITILITSIAVVYNPELDKRTTDVDAFVFPQNEESE